TTLEPVLTPTTTIVVVPTTSTTVTTTTLPAIVTTTVPNVPTTTVTTSTVTTTSTTSTTVGVSFLGTWSFSGTLALNDCDLDVSGGVQDFIVVSAQDGADIAGL